MLSPEEVENRQFNTTRLKEGYVADEVDEFLDDVAGEYRQFYKQIDDLQNQLRVARQAPAPQWDQTQTLPKVVDDETHLSAESIKSILVAAQSAADRIEADAAAQAALVQAEAERKARLTFSNAQVEAEQIVNAASSTAADRIAQLQEEEGRLDRMVADLTKQEAKYRAFLKTALEEFSGALVREEGRPGG